jgi:hypothetical protein
MSVLNSQVGHVFSVVGLDGNAVSGLTGANFLLNLRRRSGTTLIASSEAVTVQSIGGGEYWAFYTPTQAATLYVLKISAFAAIYIVSAPAEGWQDEVEAGVSVTSGPYLTTRDRVKLAFEFKQNEHDPKIDQLLPQVTDLFQNYCGRNFFQSEVTEYPTPLSNCVRIFLAGKPPIVSVTSLHFSTAIPRVHDTTTLLVEGTDFFISEDGQWIELVTPRSIWGNLTKTAKLIYVGGYSTIPGDLERAAIEVIGVKVQKSIGGGAYHFLNQSIGDGSMQGLRWDDVTPNALAVMDSYRLQAVA